MNKHSELEIFKLCERLAKLLGAEEAIADLKKLYTNHPEMFQNIKEVSKIINEVLTEPELIIKNPRAKSDKDFIAVKHLSNIENKIGDISIRNNQGTNIIFHANISASRNLIDYLKKM
ncbi:hypothetical protein [Campylobacter sp.]|uniref:hypothetical protein n=1 Tax=Campylobacter sp. TaxID=205 RepID=UPI0025BB5D83|nr:hypothetical protein [Campylobacter sp.]